MNFLCAPRLRYRPAQQAGGGVAVILCIVLFLVAGAGGYGWHYLEQPLDGQGQITLTDIRMVRETDRLHLHVNAQVTLSSTIRAGLDSGVPLTFVLGLHVYEPVALLPDRAVVELERHYKLTYYELTRHYRVHEVETNISRNFRSLSSALSGLGQFGRISIELNDLQTQRFEQSGLEGLLNMRLSKSALPLPLQPIIRSSWTLTSEEYRWPVT